MSTEFKYLLTYVYWIQIPVNICLLSSDMSAESRSVCWVQKCLLSPEVAVESSVICQGQICWIQKCLLSWDIISECLLSMEMSTCEIKRYMLRDVCHVRRYLLSPDVSESRGVCWVQKCRLCRDKLVSVNEWDVHLQSRDVCQVCRCIPRPAVYAESRDVCRVLKCLLSPEMSAPSSVCPVNDRLSDRLVRKQRKRLSKSLHYKINITAWSPNKAEIFGNTPSQLPS